MGAWVAIVVVVDFHVSLSGMILVRRRDSGCVTMRKARLIVVVVEYIAAYIRLRGTVLTRRRWVGGCMARRKARLPFK